jgi:hypothetical protein
MEGMIREEYALTRERYCNLTANEMRRLFRLVAAAHQVAELAHDDAVEMAVEIPPVVEGGVQQRFVLWSAEDLALSVYVQVLRQALADLCGR